MSNSSTDDVENFAQRHAAEIVDVCRCIMLMEPMAADFDAILMADPVPRVKMVAEAVTKAAGANDVLKDMISRRQIVPLLLAQARGRHSGQFIMPKAFLSDLVRSPAREQRNG